jgi:hypothetical protein
MLADGSTSLSHVPVQVGEATNWSQISLGGGTAAGVKASHVMYTWGDNGSGQVGNGQLGETDQFWQMPCPSQLEIGENDSIKPFTVFPNPVNDVLYLETKNEPIDRVVIFDLVGKKITDTQGRNINEINVTHLRNGMYLLQVFIGDEKQTKKFIKN